MSIRNWIDEKIISARVGAVVKIENDGKPVNELVIRYKDYFFMIMLDGETGDPTGSFGWSQGSPVTHIPIREFWTAEPSTPIKENND